MIPINKRKVGICILLSIITGGIYAIYWMYLLVKNVRALKQDNSSCTGEMLCLLFVPFYALYWWYTRGNDVKNLLEARDYHISSTGTLYLVLSIFGLGIVAMAIMQNDFNALSFADSVTHSNQRGAEVLPMKKNHELWQAIKFTLFSISAGIIQAASFALLHDAFHIENYWMCHIPSLVLSVLWNFTFNRRYTFRSDCNLPKAMSLVALYYVIFTPASAWWGTLMENAGVHDWLIEIFNMIVNFVTEFLFQKFVVYRGTIDTNELAKREKQQG